MSKNISHLFSNKDSFRYYSIYLSDETSKVGFFVRFPDYDELKEQNQYRIIPNNNAIQYHKDKDDAENAIKHSIIINGDEVISIRSGYRGMRDLTTKDFKDENIKFVWRRNKLDDGFTQFDIIERHENGIKVKHQSVTPPFLSSIEDRINTDTLANIFHPWYVGVFK